ncbi:MAG: cysteine hydrolase family protein [Desulfobacter sp.]
MLLLVVDMQKGLFTEDTPRHDAGGVVQRINLLISTFRQAGHPVMFIQHDEPENNALAPHTPGWEILDSLDRQPDDPIVRKQACDAFLDTGLADTIHDMGETRVVITGCATDFCVDTTVRSAAAKGFSVTVARDAHTTADRPHLDAVSIITHHNWSWENLTLPGEQHIRVIDTDEIARGI